MDTQTAIEVGRIGELVRRQSHDIATVIDLQRQMLDMLKENRERRGRGLWPMTQWLISIKPIAYAVALWGTAILALIYLIRGGDLLTALQSFAWLI